MKREIILTPEELYYMGALLRAKYIDYAYVAAMSDIQKNRGIYESTSKEGLAKKGILMEDFSGNMEVDEEAGKLLEPVFFGELESSVDVVSVAPDGGRQIQGKRFHFYEGRITATVMQEDGIHLEAADDGQIQAWVGSLLPVSYAAQEETVSARDIDTTQISRIISVKSNRVTQRAAVEIYVEYKGRIFQEKTGGRAMALTREKFGLEIYRGIKGE